MEMSVARANIWISDVADACGTWPGSGRATIFDCDGVLQWPCGRYLAPDGTWRGVPNGEYLNLPFRCGHLEVELPPGCYWASAGQVFPNPTRIHINYGTHVGIFQAKCDEVACVKLWNPTLRHCWDWFRVGLRRLALPLSQPALDPEKVARVEKLVEDLLKDVPRLPIESTIEKLFDDLVERAKSGERDEPG
jgi:hypothetical protein